FAQPGFDRRMAVLEAFVEHEVAAGEGVGQRRQLALDAGQLGGIKQADALQALRVGAAGLDVVRQEFAVENDVVAGEKLHDAWVDAHAVLLPQWLAHSGIPSVSGRAKARLRFCTACVAAPLSRLSRVATITALRPPGATVKPPISAWWRPAMALTHGASSSTRSSGSPA